MLEGAFNPLETYCKQGNLGAVKNALPAQLEDLQIDSYACLELLGNAFESGNIALINLLFSQTCIQHFFDRHLIDLDKFAVLPLEKCKSVAVYNRLKEEQAFSKNQKQAMDCIKASALRKGHFQLLGAVNQDLLITEPKQVSIRSD